MEEKLVSKVPENDKIYQETIFFSDNRLLIDLCGELDINLVNIENRLGVEIFRRGNQLTIIGEKENFFENVPKNLNKKKLIKLKNINSKISLKILKKCQFDIVNCLIDINSAIVLIPKR